MHERIGECNAETTGEMPVAASGRYKMRRASAGRIHGTRPGDSCQRFQRRADLFVGEAEIPEAPLGPDRDHPTIQELSQVAAGALRCDAGDRGEFAGWKRPPIGQRNEHGFARGIRQQGGNLGETSLNGHWAFSGGAQGER